jgi:hypothetical protein
MVSLFYLLVISSANASALVYREKTSFYPTTLFKYMPYPLFSISFARVRSCSFGYKAAFDTFFFLRQKTLKLTIVSNNYNFNGLSLSD